MIAAVWLCCPAAFAKPVVQNDAATAVQGWLHQPGRGLKTPLGNEVKNTEVYADAAGAPIYFVVNLKPSGFVIVPADDLVEPILFFCPAGKYVASEKNSLGALVMHDVPARLAQARAKPAAANLQPRQKKAQLKWGQLRAAATAAAALPGLSSVSDVWVAPLTQSLWDQGDAAGVPCYNYYTPTNDVDGCVATAMAQLMFFHQYPTAGVGTASFEIEANGTWEMASLRGGNGSGGPYNWAEMPPVPGNGVTSAQCQAIGALCYDAGVSVNMEYTSDSSGADPTEIVSALNDVFFYSNAICGGNGDSIGSGLIGMLNPNLDAGFPCLLSIFATDGAGHEIVADGYGYDSSTLYHHLNLGWSGYDNGWYNLPDFDAGGYDWDTVAFCTYNVYPTGSGEIVSGQVTNSTGAAISGVTVTATRAGGGVYTATTNANGIYAFAQVPSSSTYTLTAALTGYTFSPQNVSTGTSANYNSTSGDVWGANFTATSVASTWTLTVNSSPVQGASVTGTYPGATNYSISKIANGTAVSLTAPAIFVSGGTTYNFTQWAAPSGWTVSGATVSGNINSNTTLQADYAAQVWTLTVNSTPVQGVGITGTYPGTTNYSATGVTDGTAVSLTAPANDPAGYTFSQWTVNGAAQTSGQKTITFTISAATTAVAVYTSGGLAVMLSPAAAVTAGAQWQVDGGTWQNSAATVTGLSVGNHTVNYQTVPGWTAPASEQVSIASGATTSITRTYVQQTGGIQVVLGPAAAVTAGAQWNVDGGAWQNSGATVSNLVVGNHTVKYEAIAGWNTPASASVPVTSNTTTGITGTYLQQTGELTVTLEPAAAISAGAMWNVDGGGWLASGATITGLSVGTHTVNTLPLTAWSAPPMKSVVISNNETTVLVGMYGEDPTSPAVTGMLPASGTWDAPIGTLIQLHITDAGPGVDASTVTIQASPDGVTWETISDGSPSYVASNNEVFNGVTNRAGTPADYVYVFQPTASFDFEDEVYIQVSASDLDREVMPPFIYNFTIEARSFGCNVRADGSTVGDDFPATATDADGNIWVAWERTDATTQMGTLWLAERMNDAWNFSSEIPVTTVAQNGDCHKPALAITASGNIYVAYEVHGAIPAVGVVTATTAAPTTWTSLGAVAGAGNALMASPAIIVDSTGDLSVVGVSLVNGVKQVVAGTLASGTRVWTVTQVTSNSGDQISPAITQDAAGIVYVVWTNTQDNNLYGANSGAGWAPIHQVTSSGNAGSPAIAAEQSGLSPVLHFAWTATGGTPNPDIQYAETTGGWAGAPLTGTNVMDELTASNAANPRIAVTGTTSSSVYAGVFIVWQDQRSSVPGDTDIMFVERKRDGQFGTNILVSVVPPDAGLVTNSAQYNPAFGVTTNGTPYSAWTDLREAGASHIYFAAAMDACLCGSQPSSVLIPVAGGTANFTDPTNLHFTDAGITVPPNAFTTPRNVVANELRNPVAECPGGSGLFADGSGLYLDITGGVDEALGGWVTISTQLTPGAALPSPLAVYRLVPPATPLDSWTWTTDLIQNVSYNPSTNVLAFQTMHLSSFGVGFAAPAAGSSSGGGGGGGCSMSPDGEPDVFVLVLPLAALGFWTATRLIRRGSSAKA